MFPFLHGLHRLYMIKGLKVGGKICYEIRERKRGSSKWGKREGKRGRQVTTSFLVVLFFFEFKIMINNEKRIGVQLESLFFYLKYSLI